MEKFKITRADYNKPCNCRKGVERDNCPACEGTGVRIDYDAIRNKEKRVQVRAIEEVTDKLYEIDPVGLAKVGCPKDEYYTEAMLIMFKKDALTAANVRDIFYDMFEAGLAEPNYNIQKWQVDFVTWFNQEEN